MQYFLEQFQSVFVWKLWVFRVEPGTLGTSRHVSFHVDVKNVISLRQLEPEVCWHGRLLAQNTNQVSANKTTGTDIRTVDNIPIFPRREAWRWSKICAGGVGQTPGRAGSSFRSQEVPGRSPEEDQLPNTCAPQGSVNIVCWPMCLHNTDHKYLVNMLGSVLGRQLQSGRSRPHSCRPWTQEPTGIGRHSWLMKTNKSARRVSTRIVWSCASERFHYFPDFQSKFGLLEEGNLYYLDI